MIKLTKKELAWFARLEKCLAAAPDGLNKKVTAFTIGDNDITVYDHKLVRDLADTYDDERFFQTWGEKDVGQQVDNADAEIFNLVFPFTIESTAG